MSSLCQKYDRIFSGRENKKTNTNTNRTHTEKTGKHIAGVLIDSTPAFGSRAPQFKSFFFHLGHSLNDIVLIQLSPFLGRGVVGENLSA